MSTTSNAAKILGPIGANLIAALSQSLLQADFSGLGAYKGLGQAGALVFSELASVIAARWAPPAPPAPPAAS